jgi:activator of HSP90 ATPase
MTTPQLSRREFSARLAAIVPVLGLGGLRLGSASRGVPRAQGDGISRTAEAIHQDVGFPASRERVYEALLDEKQFATMTGGQAATIDRAAGGAFSLFGARIKGRNIELVPNARIIQAWRSEGWAPGVYSIVRFELVVQGTGTKIAFDHTGFPQGEAEHLFAGWKSNYWDPMAKYLAR